MPKITNPEELKAAAGRKNFLNPGDPAYQTIRQFTNGLRNVQQELAKNPETRRLAQDLGKYADGIMALQVGAPVYNEEQVSQAIWDVNRNLPGFLQGGDGKTNYQTILETAEKAGLMTRQQLDQGLTLIGDAMGTDLNVGGSRRVGPAVQQPAPREARPREHDSVRFMEWKYRHQADLKNNAAGYAGQGAVPESDQLQDESYLKRSALDAVRKLQSQGVVHSEVVENSPQRNGMPTIFLVKDGKVTTLEESGLWMTKKDEGSVKGNSEFAKAVLRGEVFAYPAGERHPVQLQARVNPDDKHSFTVTCSAPLKPGEVKLAPEPAVTRPPRWYHRAFKFWGNNRKICADYDASKAAHDKWARTAREAEAAAGAIEEKFGAKRTQAVLDAELTETFRSADAKRVADNQTALADSAKNMNLLEKGIGNAMELYAPKPVFKEEYTRGDDKLYTQESFQQLNSTDLDPSTVKIGGKPVTDREFASLAMFGSLDPDLMIKTQNDNAVDKPGPILESLQREGYSEDVSKRLVGMTIGTSSTVDVFVGDPRIHGYFGNAINGGRDNAADALKAYASNDKTKLAAILANGLVYAGEMVGATSAVNKQSVGVKGMAQLSKEMLDLMERDPELKELTKKQFEKTETAICTEISRQIEKYDPERKNILKPKSFDDTVKLVNNFTKLTELEQKGLEAQHRLADAQAREVDLLPEEKRDCIKDILKANMADAIYEQERKERADLETDWKLKLPNGEHPSNLPSGEPNNKVPVEGKHNSARFAQEEYIKALEQKGPHYEWIPGEGYDMVNPDLPPEEWVPKGVTYTVLRTMNDRFTEKAPTINRMGQPERMEELDRQAEQILEQDGLDKLSLEELNKKLVKEKTYAQGNMILRVVKLAAPQNQQAQPELNDPQLENNQRPKAGPVVV